MNKNIGKLVLTLTIIGIISALSLAFVYEWTTPYIEKHAAKARENGIFEVIPEAESFKKVEKAGKVFYEGYSESGNKVGVALIVEGPGFQGLIRVMVGVNVNNKEINNIKILKHEETPGLGARITGKEYKSNFVNKPFGDYKVVKKTPENPYQVEAISGATISSSKVTQIVEKAVNLIKNTYGSDS